MSRGGAPSNRVNDKIRWRQAWRSLWWHSQGNGFGETRNNVPLNPRRMEDEINLVELGSRVTYYLKVYR